MAANEQQLEGVDPSGVYSGPEMMEADDEAYFEAPLAQPQVQQPQPMQQQPQQPQEQQQQPQQQQQQQANPDLMRLTQQQILAQVQGGQLIPGANTQQDGANPTPNIPQGDPPPNITVNHTYNIHYQSDRPPPENARDIQAYGQELVTNINARSLEISEADTSMQIDIQHEPTLSVNPRLEVVKFFYGASGMDYEDKYIPDAKYQKHNVRNHRGKVIELKDLHARTGRDHSRECRHVGLVGNPGCGKTVLLKRYARMVLNRQVPELRHIEVVHFLNVNELVDDDDRHITVQDMLFERLVHTSTENVHKYGFSWLRRNADKVLFIFDNADKIITKFKFQVERISYSSETSLRVVLENIITDHLFRGCRTLVAARDYAWKGLKGDSRPQKFVCVGALTDEIKYGLIRSIIDGEEGEDFCYRLERFFPAARAFASDAMYLYFAISGMQWGNDHDQSKITSDVMLIVSMFQHLLRCWNTNREIIDRLPKLRQLAYDLLCKEYIRFGLRELRSYPQLEFKDFHDVVIICPRHKHHICYRLMDIDYSYFFVHQVMQEGLAAFHIGEMPLAEFKQFLAEKIHTPMWAVIRRIVCGIILNPKSRRNLMYYMEHPKWSDQMQAALKESLKEQTKMLDKLTPFERLELLASLHEAGEPVGNIIREHVGNICLGGVVLEPSDLYIISQLKPYIHDLHNVDMCIGKEINMKEFDELIKTLVMKARCIRLDIARLHVTQEHVHAVKEAFDKCVGGSKRLKEKLPTFPQTVFVLNTKISDDIAKGLRKIIQTASKDPVIRVERIEIPEEEIAVHRERSHRGSWRSRQCNVM